MLCLVYKTLSTPKGLIFSLFGHEEGQRHHLTLYHNSGWYEILSQSLFINGEWFYIFGDKAYLHRPWLQRLFIVVKSNSIDGNFNKCIS